MGKKTEKKQGRPGKTKTGPEKTFGRPGVEGTK